MECVFCYLDLTLLEIFLCYLSTLKNIGEGLNIFENEMRACWNKFRDKKTCIWVSKNCIDKSSFMFYDVYIFKNN